MAASQKEKEREKVRALVFLLLIKETLTSLMQFATSILPRLVQLSLRFLICIQNTKDPVLIFYKRSFLLILI